MAIRAKGSIRSTLITAAIIGGAYFLHYWQGQDSRPKEESHADITSVKASQGYSLLKKCQLVENRYNDGDSFFVRDEGGKEYELRLYFVDAPESRDKRFQDHRKRVTQQGDYFGGLGYEKTLSVGKKAKKFTQKALSEQPFDVWTKWENVYGGPRKYAFVELTKGGGKEFLHERLVKEGLARIYTKGAKLPRGRAIKLQKEKLRQFENSARNNKMGAWGMLKN